MEFAAQYVMSVNSSSLVDDARHHNTEPLAASALAEISDFSIGALLHRAKYCNNVRSTFESGSTNLAQLLRAWVKIVAEKGQARQWVKAHTAWDMQAAQSLYRRVAEQSLAHWVDGKCNDCHGSGVTINRCLCPACKGSGDAIIEGGLIGDKVRDMVGELEGIAQSHGARAGVRLRRN